MIHENVECPSLSPDGTRIAYKKRDRLDPAPWQLTVLDLATMRETPLGDDALGRRPGRVARRRPRALRRRRRRVEGQRRRDRRAAALHRPRGLARGGALERSAAGCRPPRPRRAAGARRRGCSCASSCSACPSRRRAASCAWRRARWRRCSAPGDTTTRWRGVPLPRSAVPRLDGLADRRQAALLAGAGRVGGVADALERHGQRADLPVGREGAHRQGVRAEARALGDAGPQRVGRRAIGPDPVVVEPEADAVDAVVVLGRRRRP